MKKTFLQLSEKNHTLRTEVLMEKNNNKVGRNQLYYILTEFSLVCTWCFLSLCCIYLLVNEDKFKG